MAQETGNSPSGWSLPPSTGDGRAFGLHDDAFAQKRPLIGLITKAEVRAVSLYYLGLRPRSTVWDVGAGSGSVAVEAALIAHDGTTYAIERDAETIPMLQENVARWGAGRVTVIHGEAPEAFSGLPAPDSVFVGGSGGLLTDILVHAAGRLREEGCIVVNLATLERAQLAYSKLKDLGLRTNLVLLSVARGKAMSGDATRLEALNPVFIVQGCRQKGAT